MSETTAQAPPAKPLRDERGRLLPGQRSINPAGISRDAMEVRRALELAAPQAAATLVALLDHKDPRVQHAAAVEILNRTVGKPREQVEVQATGGTAAALLALAAQRREEQRQVVDVTPITAGADEVAVVVVDAKGETP